MKRQYTKCEAYYFLHQVREGIHRTKEQDEIDKIVKLLEKCSKLFKKELD